MEVKINSSETTESQSFESSMSWEGSRIISVAPEATLHEAAKLMCDEQVGSVLVMDSSAQGGSLLGMITDRDIALCVGEHENIQDLRVADVMSEDVCTASVDDDIFKLVHIMKNEGVTRLPLLNDQEEVVGVATARNLLEILAKSFIDITQVGEQQRENEQNSLH